MRSKIQPLTQLAWARHAEMSKLTAATMLQRMVSDLQTHLVNVLLIDCKAKISFLELPLLVTFIDSRMSCKASVQFPSGGKSAPTAPAQEDSKFIFPSPLALHQPSQS